MKWSATRYKTHMRLADALTDGEPKATTILSPMERGTMASALSAGTGITHRRTLFKEEGSEGLSGRITDSISRIQAGMQTFSKEVAAPFAGRSRHQQLEEITTEEVAEISSD